MHQQKKQILGNSFKIVLLLKDGYSYHKYNWGPIVFFKKWGSTINKIENIFNKIKPKMVSLQTEYVKI